VLRDLSFDTAPIIAQSSYRHLPPNVVKQGLAHFKGATMPRPILAEANLHAAIRPQVLGYHADIITEVQAALAAHKIVIVGMRWNDAVWQARKLLKKAGQEFHYIEYGSYTSGWRKRLALKMWTGWPTFPMVFVNGTLVGGGSDLKALMKSGPI
jgi:monothiol glutaredoxin